MSEAYIVASARTAGGRRGGRLTGWHPRRPRRPGPRCIDRPLGRRPEIGRGRDHGLRQPVRPAVGQCRAQRGDVVEAARERPRHVGRSPVRQQPAGAPLRRRDRDERPDGHRHRRRRRIDDPRADGRRCQGRARGGPRQPLRQHRHQGALSGRVVQPVHRRRDDRQEVQFVEGRPRRLRLREPAPRRRRDQLGRIPRRDRRGRSDAARWHQGDAHRRRGHPASTPRWRRSAASN